MSQTKPRFNITEDHVRDLRVGGMYQFLGLQMRCTWENKDKLRNQLIQDNKKAIRFDDIMEEFNREKDADNAYALLKASLDMWRKTNE